jgi:transcriptional regulator with XRE-family HTH domain
MVAGGFALALRERRERVGLSQRALARAAGVTPAYVSLIEQGRRSPERDVVERLVRALSLSPAEANTLRSAAGYVPLAPVDGSPGETPVSQRIDQLLAEAPLSQEQRGAVESLMLIYLSGLITRAREGRPLVSDLSAPWQARVLEALQEHMADDFHQFRDAYLNRIFEL